MFNKKEISRIFDQVMNIWIKPEMERRKLTGQIKDGFELKRAQIIFTLGKSSEIKFNEEVSIRAEVKVNRSIIKGEDIKESDIEKIERFIVDYPLNSGHITLFRFSNKWIIIFDARYNKGKIKRTLDISRDFYESAKDDLEKGRLIPFYENCWNSAELSSVCHVLCRGGKNKGHGENVKDFVEWSELGNVDKKHAEALSRLKDLRKTKYSLSLDFKTENSQEFMKIVGEMIDDAEKLASTIKSIPNQEYC